MSGESRVAQLVAMGDTARLATRIDRLESALTLAVADLKVAAPSYAEHFRADGEVMVRRLGIIQRILDEEV